MAEKQLEIKSSISSEIEGSESPSVWGMPQSDLTIIEKVNKILAQYSSIPESDKVIFYRLLSTMINAWVSLVDSLGVLKDQVKTPKLSYALHDILYRISSWTSLSSALAVYPDIFDTAEVWVIKAWEKSWKLNRVLIQLATQIEKSALISSKIKWAMIYPVVIILIVFWALYAIMIYVIPKIKDMFESMWAELPWLTQQLIKWSDFLTTNWVYFWIEIFNWLAVLLFLLLIAIMFISWKKTKSWSLIFAKIVLRMPIFWQLMRKMVIAKFCWAISLLTWSWLSVIDSLRLTSDMVWNEAYRIRVQRILLDVQKWLTMWQNMKQDVLYFPNMVASMIYVWEKTAQLEEVSWKVADYYEEDVDGSIKNLMQLLEPLIIVVVGWVVAVMVIAVMLPLMSMSEIIN